MVTFIAQKPPFSSIMMYILGKKLCKTPADFRQISVGILPGPGRGLAFWPGPGTRSITDINTRL